ncbi:hypothetical protein B6D60_02220 [candidate division KSB1 bacterium 4484_87]|nr:MAG: hypothetical protein B6D60_02220 [candidate division KSB1 bacterium 4484_87]
MKHFVVALVSVLLVIIFVGAFTVEFAPQKWSAEIHLAKKAKAKQGDPLPLPPPPPPPTEV